MVKRMQNKQVDIISRECEYGKVIAIFDNDAQYNDVPWDLWARIFRLYSHDNKQKFRVYFLANTDLRLFPKKLDTSIKPQNINGGYTYRCNPETILVYRAEDATRVLIHELMHSCCLDNPANTVDIIEAETEAWAEYVYVGLLSRADVREFRRLLVLQSSWIKHQNQQIRKYMKHTDSIEFPWRYTIGKEEVWKRWGILSDNVNTNTRNISSLRLTYPPTDTIKNRFHVKSTSTIL